MFTNTYPLFEDLEKEDFLLEQTFELLRDNPLDMLHLIYAAYKDGIISGFNLITNAENKKVIIQSGILKKANDFFWMEKNYAFDMPLREAKYIVKLKLDHFDGKHKYYHKIGKCIIEEGEEVQNDEIELTRFITREGEELRNNYFDFKDLKRDFNLLNIIYVKFSSRHVLGTLHPILLNFFGKEVMEKECLDAHDIIFANACLNNSVERENIIDYVNKKSIKQKNDYTNDELYEALLEILTNLGKDFETNNKERFKPEKILVY